MFGHIFWALVELWRSGLPGFYSSREGIASPGACLASGTGALELIMTLFLGAGLQV